MLITVHMLQYVILTPLKLVPFFATHFTDEEAEM